MMKTNRIWSILSKGQPYGNPEFTRKVTPSVYDDDNDEGRSMLDALAPYNDELLRAVYAEYVGQFLLGSQLRDRALDLDPVNTYGRARMQFPPPGPRISPILVTDPFSIHTTADPEELLDQGTGLVQFTATVDTGANTFTADGDVIPYTVTNGLSSAIEVFPGLDLRLRSDFAAPTYEFVYRYTLPAAVRWDMLRNRIGYVTPTWSTPDLEAVWDTDPRWDQRLAAFVMSTMELCNRA
jgi:hypothetical protein